MSYTSDRVGDVQTLMTLELMFLAYISLLILRSINPIIKLTSPVEYFFFKILFMYSWEAERERQRMRERERERERQRHRQREKRAPCREPYMGLDPRYPGSALGQRWRYIAEPPKLPSRGIFGHYFNFNITSVSISTCIQTETVFLFLKTGPFPPFLTFMWWIYQAFSRISQSHPWYFLHHCPVSKSSCKS